MYLIIIFQFLHRQTHRQTEGCKQHLLYTAKLETTVTVCLSVCSSVYLSVSCLSHFCSYGHASCLIQRIHFTYVHCECDSNEKSPAILYLDVAAAVDDDDDDDEHH